MVSRLLKSCATPPGELPDRFQLLRLAQRLLGLFQQHGPLPLLGHVAGDAVEPALDGHRPPGEGPIAAVARPEAVLEGEGAPAGREACDLGTGPLMVIRVLQPLGGPSDDLVRLPAEDRGPGRVDADPGAFDIRDAEHVMADLPDPVALLGPGLDMLGQGGVQRFQRGGGRLPLPFGPDPLADVPRDADQLRLDRLPGLEGCEARLPPARLALGGRAEAVGADELAGRRTPDRVPDPGAVAYRPQLGELPPKHVPGRSELVQLHAALVHVLQPALGREHHHAIGAGREDAVDEGGAPGWPPQPRPHVCAPRHGRQSGRRTS